MTKNSRPCDFKGCNRPAVWHSREMWRDDQPNLYTCDQHKPGSDLTDAKAIARCERLYRPRRILWFDKTA